MSAAQTNLISQFIEKYDALLLDLDGTIVTSEDMHAHVGSIVISNHGVKMDAKERFLMKGLGEAKVWDKLAAEGRPLQISQADFISAHAKQYLEYLRSVQDPKQILRPWMPELIDAFHASGKPIGIVSNTTKSIVEATLDAAQIRGKIKTVISYDDMKAAGMARKPAPDGWIALTSDLGVAAGRSLLIGDNKADIDSGDAANNIIEGKIELLQIVYDRIGEIPDVRSTYAVHDTNDSIGHVFKNCATANPRNMIAANDRGLPVDVYVRGYNMKGMG